MARIRTVKPELFRHEALFEAEQECGLPLRLAFIGLFTVCDRAGVFRWQPRQLKLDVMPYDAHEFSRVLDALMTRGFVVKYVCGSEEYGVIPSFTRHQVINNKEKQSSHPQIDEADHVFDPKNNDLSTREVRVDVASTTPLNPDQGEGNRKGREVEGEQEGNMNNPTRQPRGKQAPIQLTAGEMIDQLPGLSMETAEEYRAFRKQKKAPLTAGAWKTIVKEIHLSKLPVNDALNTAMARGWTGFEASWLQNKQSGFSGLGKQEAIEAHNQRVVEEIMRREQQRLGTATQDEFNLGDSITIEGEVINAY